MTINSTETLPSTFIPAPEEMMRSIKQWQDTQQFDLRTCLHCVIQMEVDLNSLLEREIDESAVVQCKIIIDNFHSALVSVASELAATEILIDEIVSQLRAIQGRNPALSEDSDFNAKLKKIDNSLRGGTADVTEKDSFLKFFWAVCLLCVLMLVRSSKNHSQKIEPNDKFEAEATTTDKITASVSIQTDSQPGLIPANSDLSLSAKENTVLSKRIPPRRKANIPLTPSVDQLLKRGFFSDNSITDDSQPSPAQLKTLS